MYCVYYFLMPFPDGFLSFVPYGRLFLCTACRSGANAGLQLSPFAEQHI